MKKLIVLSLLSFLLICCGGDDGGGIDTTNDVKLDVPYEPNHYSTKGCGTCCSSSFTMTLKYLDPMVNFSDVFAIFGCPPFNDEYEQFMDYVNTTYPELTAWGACESTIDDIIEVVDRGYPVVVHQVFSQTERTGHNRVVIGYNLDRNELIMHDPTPAGHINRLDFETFEELWFDISILESVQPYCMWVIEHR